MIYDLVAWLAFDGLILSKKCIERTQYTELGNFVAQFGVMLRTQENPQIKTITYI